MPCRVTSSGSTLIPPLKSRKSQPLLKWLRMALPIISASSAANSTPMTSDPMALTFSVRMGPKRSLIALGAHASGLFANDDALAAELLAAGMTAGDRAWQMPLWDDYQGQLKSNFA